MNDTPQLPTSAQCRAVRGLLNMTYADVCREAEISQGSLTKLEAGGEVRASVADRVRAAFEARGVTLSPDGRGVSW